MDHYDLVVIGSGPAGEGAAAQASIYGKRVAVVERTGPKVGGACAHTGTLPSKTLRETAVYMSGLRSRLFTPDVLIKAATGVTVAEFMHREQYVTHYENNRILSHLTQRSIDLLQGEASFIDPHTLRLGAPDGSERKITADVIVIATGSSPVRPPHIPFDGVDLHDSDTLLNLDLMPESLTVVGAGVIGCEYASIFAALGCKVTLLERSDRLLTFVDHEIIDLLLVRLKELGIEVLFHADVEKIEVHEGWVYTSLKDGRQLKADKALYAAGRKSNVERLNLEAAGVKATDRGLVMVNELYQTAAPHIYAAGDVIGYPALASTSREQGRLAMQHAFAGRQDLGESTRRFPYAIYTIPSVASFGPTEEQLKAANTPYEVGRALASNNARGQIQGDSEGLLKLLFDPKTRELLAVHIVGASASELVHIGMMVVLQKGTLETIVGSCFNYPTLAELYKDAAYDGLSRLTNGQMISEKGAPAIQSLDAGTAKDAAMT